MMLRRLKEGAAPGTPVVYFERKAGEHGRAFRARTDGQTWRHGAQVLVRLDGYAHGGVLVADCFLDESEAGT